MFFTFYCIFFILLLKLRIYEPFIYLYNFVKIIKVFFFIEVFFSNEDEFLF